MSDVSAIAATGDHLATLEALRDRLAEQIDDTGARDLPRLVSELRAVMDQIADLNPPEEEQDALASLVVLPGAVAG